jgi:glutamate dehydrogenase
MFKLPRSSWADYDRSLISAGGGIWPRSAKRIELNDAMRALLAAEASALDGEAMVAAILRAPVDMIYNGGIGTYVRASSESDDDVGDRANDACRIAAAELRAKVVVEGGNLGFTNAARIEYALGGGRINTDAIDNSAGVDMSDHEVNLKIALTPPVARGDLSIDDRNAILAECAADVASAVIANNRDQVLSLSLEQIRSRLAPGGYADHASDLVRRSVIRSDIAALPTRAALDARRAKYAGLARPELAVIAAYTKIDLASQLKDSKFIRDPYLNGRFVVPYFPASVAARFPEAVAAHSLHAALAATQLANEMVDLMGSTFAFELERDTGRDGCAIARAWLVAADIVGAPDRIAALKDNRAIAPDAELAAIIAMARAVGGASRWVLETLAADAKIGPEIARLRPAFTALESEFESMLAASERDRFERSYRELRASVGDGELAHALSRIEFANHILEIIALAHARGDDAVRVAAVYFGLEAQLDFGRIDQGLAAIQGDDMWTRRARTESNAELRAARNLLTASALDDRTRDGAAAIESMLSRCAHERARAESILEELRAAPALTPAALHVAIRALSRLAEAADSGLRGI